MSDLPPPSAADYLWQFQRLLPRGAIWHRGWGTVQAQDLLTLMPTWARLHARTNNLLIDAFPCTTDELLPEWEATLGLPDPCIGELPTVQQRQAAVCAKFAARGGQSIDYFVRLAASLGYTITITQFAPFRAGVNCAGDPDNSDDWAYAWQVNVDAGPDETITYFRADQSHAGEPLAAWGDEALECLIREYAPAHTTVIFAYVTESVWDQGASIWDGGASRWDYRGVAEVEQPIETLIMRLPAPVLASLIERAKREGVRPERLIELMVGQ